MKRKGDDIFEHSEEKKARKSDEARTGFGKGGNALKWTAPYEDALKEAIRDPNIGLNLDSLYKRLHDVKQVPCSRDQIRYKLRTKALHDFVLANFDDLSSTEKRKEEVLSYLKERASGKDAEDPYEAEAVTADQESSQIPRPQGAPLISLLIYEYLNFDANMHWGLLSF
jgi:hypothetical protein